MISLFLENFQHAKVVRTEEIRRAASYLDSFFTNSISHLHKETEQTVQGSFGRFTGSGSVISACTKFENRPQPFSQAKVKAYICEN